MTQVIDERVVEMKFNNQDFEKNVAQSMSTLEKLKQALNFNVTNNLSELGTATKSFDLSGVSTAIETVNANFSAMQVVGMTAISELTRAAMDLGATLISKVVEPIRTGGMNRALNIEQAKFQLKGLGVAWEDIEEDINYGVKSTAYGLDVAARAAAQFAASNVQLGDDMKAALRGISGVAAMTGASYQEISDIFTTVSGKGKAMAAEFNRIGQRGLNAKAAVANYMNAVSLGTKEVSDSVKASVKEITKGMKVTEADIADLASKGKINFEIFSKALDDAFGAHAKAANDTFSGAMDNVRAAWSRIGANFATPYLENVRLIAVEGIKVIDELNKALKPFYKESSDIIETIQRKVTKILKAPSVKSGIVNIIEGMTTAFHALQLILIPVKEAFREVFPKENLFKKFLDVTEAFKKFTDRLVLSEKDTENFKRTMRGLFAILDMIKIAFDSAINVIRPFGKDLKELTSALLEYTAKAGDYLVSLRDGIKANNTLYKTFSKVAFGIRVAAMIIKNAFTTIKEGFKSFKSMHIDTMDFSGIKAFFNRFIEAIKSFSSVGDFIKDIFNGIANAFEGFKPVAEAIGELISSLVGGVLQGFSNAFGGGKFDAFSAFINMLSTTAASSLILQLANSFAAFTTAIRTAGGLNPVLVTIKTGLVKTFAEIQADIKADVLTRIAKALALFTASLFVLSLINPDRLAGATGMLIGLLTAMTYMLRAITILTRITPRLGTWSMMLKTEFTNFANAIQTVIKSYAIRSLAISLIAMAGAVAILAVAVSALSKAFKEDPGAAIFGLIAVEALLGELAVIAKFLTTSNFAMAPMGTVSQVIAFAIAVGILVSSIKTLAELLMKDNIGAVGAALGIVTVLLIELSLIAEFIGHDSKFSLATGLAMVEMAGAVWLIAQAIAQLGALPIEQIFQGGAAAAAILFALGIFLKVTSEMGNLGDMKSTGVAVLALAASMWIIASAIRNLATLKPEEIGHGMVALAVALVAMAGGLKLLSDSTVASDLVSTAGALVIFGAAAVLISHSIATLAKQDPAAVALSLVALFASIGILAAASKLLEPFMGSILKLSASLLVFGIAIAAISGGLILLAVAVGAFMAIGPDFLNVLLEIGIAIGAFAVAALVLQSVAVPMLILAGVIAAIGLAAVIAGAGITLIATGLAAIAAIGVVGAAAIEAVGMAMFKLGGDLLLLSVAMLAFTAVLVAFNLACIVLAPEALPALLMVAIGVAAVGAAGLICGAALLVMAEGLKVIANVGSSCAGVIAEIANGLGLLGESVLLIALGAAALTITMLSLALTFGAFGVSLLLVEAAMLLLVATSVAAAAGLMVYGAAAIVAGAGTALLAGSLAVIFAIIKELIPSIGGITDGFENGLNEALKGITDTIEGIKNGIGDEISNMIQLGKDFLSGFLKGLEDVPILGSIVKAGKGIAQAAINAVKATQDSNSPSKVTEALGEDFGIGYGQGIDKTKPEVEKSAEGVADTAIEELDGIADEANEAGKDADTQLGLGLLENIPFVKSSADQVRQAADLSDVAQQSEWDMHTVGENYNRAMKLKKAYENPASKKKNLKQKEDDLLGITRETTEAIDDETEALDLNTDATGKNSKAKEEKKHILESLQDTLTSQMDVFNKLELKTDISSTQMLENMKSNLDGFASWSAKLASLTERGINKALWEKLAEMGPKGYAELNAFVNMTDEQLQQANEMYVASMAMDDAVIAQIAPGYEKLGGQIPKGVAQGIAKWQSETTDAIKKEDEAMQAQFKEDNGIASPSKVYQEFGIFMMEGLRLGISDPSMLIFLEDTISLVSRWNILQTFKDILTYDEFFSIGLYIPQGLADGILAGAEAAYAAANEVATTCMEIMKDVPKESSPSKVTRGIGQYISKGLAIGILDGAENVYKASREVADNSIDGVIDLKGRLQDLINTSMDFNPIITPMLDLSYIRSQVSSLDAMLNDPTVGIGIGQNGGNVGGTNINFTQNNYSPKALSRIEIYRQTKNQISMMKGAVAR